MGCAKWLKCLTVASVRAAALLVSDLSSGELGNEQGVPGSREQKVAASGRVYR